MAPERGPNLYHVTRPPRAGGDGPHPTLLLLHGRGADEQDLLPLVGELDPRLFVVSVRAPLTLGPGYAWYHLLDIGNPELKSFTASLTALADLIEKLSEIYPVDGSRIITLGFSQGAMMAGSLLLTLPTAMAGTVMLSGYLPLGAVPAEEEAALTSRPVFVGHGTQDPLLPIALGRQARDFFTRVKADLTYREYPIAHFIGPQEFRDVADWIGKRLA